MYLPLTRLLGIYPTPTLMKQFAPLFKFSVLGTPTKKFGLFSVWSQWIVLINLSISNSFCHFFFALYINVLIGFNEQVIQRLSYLFDNVLFFQAIRIRVDFKRILNGLILVHFGRTYGLSLAIEVLKIKDIQL